MSKTCTLKLAWNSQLKTGHFCDFDAIYCVFVLLQYTITSRQRYQSVYYRRYVDSDVIRNQESMTSVLKFHLLMSSHIVLG